MREVLLVTIEINHNVHGEDIVSPCVLQKEGTSHNEKRQTRPNKGVQTMLGKTNMVNY